VYRLIVATVLLAIVLAVLVLRRGSPARTRVIKVTARAALHRGAFVAVVEVDGRRLLVGAGAQQVTLLGELDPEPPESSDPATEGAATPPAGGVSPAAGGLPGPAAGLLERVRRATTRVPRNGPR
jgi:flagellar biogenesis protein FliO